MQNALQLESHLASDESEQTAAHEIELKEQQDISNINIVQYSYILNQQSHLKYLIGPLYYFYLLPSNKYNFIKSRILWFLICCLYVSFTMVILYIFSDIDKIGSDSCTENEAKIGFLIVIFMVFLTQGTSFQLWLNIWNKNQFQSICFNNDIFEKILTQQQRNSYNKKFTTKFWIAACLGNTPLPILLIITTTISPFDKENYQSSVSWIIFIIIFLIMTISSMPALCIVGTFSYYTDLLTKYIDFKQKEIEKCDKKILNLDDSQMSNFIVNEYKKVREHINIASMNYNTMNVFVVSSHVISVFLDVIYFLQCSNRNNYILLIALIVCSNGFILPLYYMSNVTAKARKFEKTVLFKLDKYGSVHSGFTTYVLSVPIGYTFATEDIIMTKKTVFAILNATATILLGVYRSVLIVK